MLLIGLTGSLGMGKSTTLRLLRRLVPGLAVYDADAAVHDLYRDPVTVAAITRAFPSAKDGKTIDRKKLGAIVFDNPVARRQLEAILHPCIARTEYKTLAAAARRRAKLVVLDIPLLFETGGTARVDQTLVVTAPSFVQVRRVLARGISPQRMLQILSSQLPDADKKRMANTVISTGLGRAHTTQCLQRWVRMLKTVHKHHRSWKRLGYLKEFYARNCS